jgi:hypothetical protein
MKKKNKDKTQKSKRKINKKVIFYSLMGLAFVSLSFFVDWMFVIGAVACVYLNQKELSKKR